MECVIAIINKQKLYFICLLIELIQLISLILAFLQDIVFNSRQKKEYNDVKQRKTHYRISLLQAQKGEEGVGREARGRKGRGGEGAGLYDLR